MPEHRVTQTLLYVIAAAIGGLLVATVVSLPTSTALKQPLTITACNPSVFVDGECTEGAEVPDTVVLGDDLSFMSVGTRCIEETVAYETVEVAWVHLESEARFPVLDVPITWDEGCEAYPAQEWVPPSQLLALSTDPGEDDLGRWRIVGTAIPVRKDTYSTYQWDVVGTFRLIKNPNP